MKRFYSALALAAAVTLSATAADVKRVNMLDAATFDTQSLVNRAEKPAKAPQKVGAASNIEELQGIYTVTCKLPLNGFEGDQTMEFAIIPGSDADHIKIIGLMPAVIEAQVNYPGGIITIPGTLKFEDNGEALTMVHWLRTENGVVDANDDPVVWVIFPDGEIEADNPDDILLCAIDAKPDYFKIFGGYDFKLKKQVDAADENWQRIGDAAFMDDGFFLPAFETDFTEIAIPCELQRDMNHPEHLRLYNAYGGLNQAISNAFGVTDPAEYIDLNTENLPGSIQLNAEFPYCVAVPPSYIGVVNGGLWYGSNMEASSLEGANPEEQAQALLNSLGADRLSVIDYDTSIAIIRNCEFKNASFGSNYNSWSSLYTEAHVESDVADVLTIFLPEPILPPSALGAIKADENAPVEYFNLQGVRIDNPGSGLYIRRQGNNVTKVVR